MKRIFTISGLVLLCFFFINSAFAQNITVKGKITDGATNETLIGVSVSVKGTTTGTQSDANGAFSISAPSNATLVFTYIGYTVIAVALIVFITRFYKQSIPSTETDPVIAGSMA